MSWIQYHLTGPAGSLPTPQHRKTPQYGGQLLLPHDRGMAASEMQPSVPQLSFPLPHPSPHLLTHPPQKK